MEVDKERIVFLIGGIEQALNESKYQKLSDVPDFDNRCSMKPGLTGITQIYAPKDLSIEKKIKYDLLYGKRQSFLLDIKLILLSFWVTLKGRWEEENRGVKGLLGYREVRSKGKRGHLLRSMGANLTDSLPKRRLKQSLFCLDIYILHCSDFLPGKISN